MSFKIRDTSESFQPVYEPEPEPETSKNSKKKTKSVPRVTKKQPNSGGFQVRHDHTNQSDYF